MCIMGCSLSSNVAWIWIVNTVHEGMIITLASMSFDCHHFTILSGILFLQNLQVYEFLGIIVHIYSMLNGTGLAYFGWLLSPNIQPTEAFSGVKRKAQIFAMNQTQKLITRLIVYSVNTGLWTAILSVFCVVTIMKYPTTFIFIGLYMPIASLYCNTLLANLNVRHYLRGSQEVISMTTTTNQDDLATVRFAIPNVAASENMGIELSEHT
ncbi:hypothetical protein FB446DRAFT_774936, partial [Lentinula raphanica]